MYNTLKTTFWLSANGLISIYYYLCGEILCSHGSSRRYSDQYLQKRLPEVNKMYTYLYYIICLYFQFTDNIMFITHGQYAALTHTIMSEIMHDIITIILSFSCFNTNLIGTRNKNSECTLLRMRCLHETATIKNISTGYTFFINNNNIIKLMHLNCFKNFLNSKRNEKCIDFTMTCVFFFVFIYTISNRKIVQMKHIKSCFRQQIEYY